MPYISNLKTLLDKSDSSFAVPNESPFRYSSLEQKEDDENEETYQIKSFQQLADASRVHHSSSAGKRNEVACSHKHSVSSTHRDTEPLR